MRKDYKYVDKATDIGLVTTELGHVRVNDDKLDTKNGTNDLLLAVEQDYFIVTPDKPMSEWYGEYVEEYKKIYDAGTPTTWDEFKKAFTDGYITITKIIWD